MQKNRKVSPSLCPLCGDNNHCLNLSNKSKSASCWCTDSKIVFSRELLAKVPPAERGKSCICKSCAMKHQKVSTVAIYEP